MGAGGQLVQLKAEQQCLHVTSSHLTEFICFLMEGFFQFQINLLCFLNVKAYRKNNKTKNMVINDCGPHVKSAGTRALMRGTWGHGGGKV